MSEKIAQQIQTVSSKFHWWNGLLAFLVIALPQIVDYLAKTEFVNSHKELYGVIALLVGLFTKFYIHQKNENGNQSEPPIEDEDAPIDGYQ
jgi:hypothetical protein